MASQQSRSTQKRDEPSRQQSGPTRHLEIETKLEIGAGTALPELAGRRSLATVGLAAAAGPVVHELDAVYFDTSQLDLLRSKLTLRHRTGGDDAGWDLKLPAIAGARTEIGPPLGAEGPRRSGARSRPGPRSASGGPYPQPAHRSPTARSVRFAHGRGRRRSGH